jgi:hypothetical protein
MTFLDDRWNDPEKLPVSKPGSNCNFPLIVG